jgi:hypothetical protein
MSGLSGRSAHLTTRTGDAPSCLRASNERSGKNSWAAVSPEGEASEPLAKGIHHDFLAFYGLCLT